MELKLTGKAATGSPVGLEREMLHVFALAFICAQMRLQSGHMFVFLHHRHRRNLSDVGVLWNYLFKFGTLGPR